MRRLVPALAAVLLVAGCDDGGTTTTATTRPAPRPATTTTTTGVAPCPPVTDAARRPVETEPAGIPLLYTDVEVGTPLPGCLEQVVITFEPPREGERLGYRVAYEGAGDVLTVLLHNGTGVDLTGDEPRVTYDGPTIVARPGTTVVRDVRRLEDFEGVTRWAVRLHRRVAFNVAFRGDRLVVSLVAPG